ncbi:FG-GAP repeat domain-containing protein [Streptomyces sp. NPDC021224]|uniref:FG-GAP repeat domain-containing protein n=1 Tax=unclassified Streptomyces TaxID=2593676 RepID=UPI0037960F73
MSESQPARATSRRRLVAVCTAGILSLGAFALGTSAQAAEPGAHSVNRPKAPAGAPHVTSPWKAAGKASKKLAKSGTADATGVTPAPQRYDIDGDGIGDQLVRGNDYSFYNSLATESEEIGAASEQFVDVVTPGDLTGAGGPSVLATTSGGKLELFTPGNFPNSPSWTGSGWGVYNKLVATDDITGDGKPDIIARDYSGKLWLYPGTGKASGEPFAARISLGSGWGAYDQLASPGDLNADGISDLVARTSDGTLWFYQGTGKATAPYVARTSIGKGWNGYNQLIGLGNGPTGSGALFARTTDGSIYSYLSNGKGGFEAREFNTDQWNVDLLAGAGSIPAWGKKDLLGETADGTLWWYGTDNAGHLTKRYPYSADGGFSGQFNLTFSNSLTNDGLPDLLERYGSLLYNDDLGTDISTGWGSYNLIIGPGDLSGDGKGDLLVRDTSGKLYIYRGAGDALHFSARVADGSGWNTYNAIVGAGDVNSDGRADIVARDTSGTLWLYKGTGNVSAPFNARVKIGTGWNTYNKLVSPGDMDGDGRADLFGVDASGTAWFYSANGTGGYKARVKIGTGWNTYKKLF